MSQHAFSRIWIHLIWGTHSRERMLHREARTKISGYLDDYAKSKGIYVEINHVNADHVHVLFDLPRTLPVEEVAQLLKGSSSHWVKQNDVVPGKFSWGRGYGAFSVSQSRLRDTVKYIREQEKRDARQGDLDLT